MVAAFMAWIAFILGVGIGFVVCIIWWFRQSLLRVWHRITVKPESPVFASVTYKDYVIVCRARDLLSSKSIWNKNYQGHCILGESLSLYCALALAAKELAGSYQLSAAYRQFTLAAILQKYPKRYRYNPDPVGLGQDPLLNFNNFPSTCHSEVLALLDDVATKLQTVKK